MRLLTYVANTFTLELSVLEIIIFLVLIAIIGILFFALKNQPSRYSDKEVEDMSPGELQHRNAQYSALISSIGDGLITTDGSGRITFINKAATHMLGVVTVAQLESLVGSPVEHVLRLVDEEGNDIPKDYLPVYDVLQTKKPVDSTKLMSSMYVSVEGLERFPISYTAAPIRFAGKNVGCALIFRNNSWQEEINATKNEFVNLASHQLRTPITTINWYVELLENTTLDEQQRGLTKQLKDGAHAMHKLVVELLEVSRLELGSLVIHPKTVDIVSIAEDILKDKHTDFEEKQLSVDRHFADDKIEVSGDTVFIKVALENIVSNAIKYTPSGGRIRVDIQRAYPDSEIDGVTIQDKGAIVEVRDTGLGIPEAQQSSIFSKMFRADNVRLENIPGTGLGLYMVHLIIQKLSGSIWFTSAENEGTTFKVYVPYTNTKSHKKEKR